MYNEVDRLPDSYWTENELHDRAINIVEPSRYDRTAKHICWYLIYKDGVYTGKAMLLVVESVVDGMNAVNKVLEPVGLQCTIGEYGDEDIMNGARVEMLYQILEKWQYVGSTRFVGDNRVFDYEQWMANLVEIKSK